VDFLFPPNYGTGWEEINFINTLKGVNKMKISTPGDRCRDFPKTSSPALHGEEVFGRPEGRRLPLEGETK